MKKQLLMLLASLLVFREMSLAEIAERQSEEGHFLLRIQTEPLRPVVGNNVVTLTIVDSRSGNPVEGARIEAIPWMTLHGHGSSKKTHIKEVGKGIYVVEDVFFTMTGDWDLLITVQKSKTEDRAVVTFKNVKN